MNSGPWPIIFQWEAPERPWRIGDAWFMSGRGFGHLSIDYMLRWDGHRKPLAVFTPAGLWSPDHSPSDDPEASWVVTLDVAELLPGAHLTSLSVTPSLNSANYHGWITAGFLTVDLEGRSYAR